MKKIGFLLLLISFTNVYGKWCKPNYNSVVATFCYQITRNETITISDPNKELSLIYVDDVIKSFIDLLTEPILPGTFEYRNVKPTYTDLLGNSKT